MLALHSAPLCKTQIQNVFSVTTILLLLHLTGTQWQLLKFKYCFAASLQPGRSAGQ